MQLHFVVAGFSKCGTTSLCNLLNSHPQTYLPPRYKEPRFFSRADYPLRWNWYRNLFHDAPAEALLGEGSVSYTEYEFAQESLHRLLQHFPKVKVILIARDPVDRIESSYREMHNSGTDWGIHCPYNIYDALIKMPNMLYDTMYRAIWEIYHQYLPKDQLLVLFQEDLKSAPQAVLDQCFSFLGLETFPINYSSKKPLNQRTDKYYDTPEMRELRKVMLHPLAAKASYKVPVKVQNQFLPQLQLREAFGKSLLSWSKEAKKMIVEVLGKDPLDFLSQHDKDPSFWPRYTSFMKDVKAS